MPSVPLRAKRPAILSGAMPMQGYTRTKRPLVCMHCGMRADVHCEFEAAMPAGCLCPPGEWGGYVLDICPAHVGDDEQCERCEHDRTCHP